MRLNFLVIWMLILGAFLATGCASRTSKIEVVPSEEARQTVENSPEEQEVRARAEEIRQRLELEAAKRTVASEDTPFERQARLELQREVNRAQKARSKVLAAITRAQISGCDPQDMFVHPDAVEFSVIRDSVTVRVLNQSSEYRNIETSFRGLGVIVSDLCPGASLSLSFARDIWFGSDYETINLISVGSDHPQNFSMTLSLSYGNRGVRHTNYTWVLR